MRRVPAWFPGTGFQQTAHQWASELKDTTEKPYAFVKHQMAQGKNEPSFLSQLLDQSGADAEEAFNHKWSALSLYTGGADTVSFSDIRALDWDLTLSDCIFDCMLLSGNDSVSGRSAEGSRRD